MVEIQIHKESVYRQNGFNSRGDYLCYLEEEHGVNLETVEMMADLLGPSEDFDGLVTSLQDYFGD